MSALVGGIEAGGTKFVAAVGTGPDDLRALERFDTTRPEQTLPQIVEFFRGQVEQHGPLAAVGIGSFGPVDLRPDSATWGYITSTPKPGWRNTDLAGAMREGLGVPVAFDTDVNAAALGEWTWGAARELKTFLYLTVGTGIGGGGLIGGQLMHGLVHPEMGHLRIPHDRERDPYAGHCPFHGDCWEGLAAGPAIADRWGVPATELPDDHPAWDLQADYMAWALVNLICTLSPERIVLGGGVMRQPGLHEKTRRLVLEYLNAYIESPAITDAIDQYIVPPGLEGRAGVLGAIALAQRLLAA